MYYSLDGSIPNLSSIKYSKAIYIDTNTVIRAVAYSENKRLTSTQTNSYLISNRKFTLPIISITVNSESMFNSTSGLYMKGPNATAEPPYDGANFHQDKELAINVEYFDTANNLGFNQQAGLKIFGAYSRGLPQKSFSIISRSEYGNKNFDYPLFPDLPFDKYKSFVLRNGGSDNNRTHFRDVFMTQLVKDLSFDIQSYHTCIVFINGKYWGIYHIREKLNEHFIKQHYDVDKDSITIMKHRMDLKIGKYLNYLDILNFIKKTDFSDDKNVDSLNKLIDIHNYLEYNVCETYFANTDAGGNIRYWRTWDDTSRWRWIMFDTDFGFGLDGATAYKKNSIEDFTKASNELWPYPAWSTMIIRNLLKNDSIKNEYINKFCFYIATIFDSTTVLNKVDEFVNLLEPEIDFQHKRWGSNRSRWDKEITRVKDFAKYRAAYIYEFLEAKFNLSNKYRLRLIAPENGDLFLNNYLIEDSINGLFYGDIPQKLKVIPKKWYYLDSWQGLDSKEIAVKTNLSSDVLIKPILKKKPKSDQFGQVKFSEINMKRQQGMSDWLELFNLTNTKIDLSHWFLLRDGKKEFELPDSTYLLPNGYLVITKENKVLDSLFKIKSIPGMFALKDTSKIELYTSEGHLVDSIKLNFIGKEHIELVNIWSNKYSNLDWKVIDELTPGYINVSVREQLQFNKLMNYFIIPGIALLILISIIFILLRKRRLRSSTE